MTHVRPISRQPMPASQGQTTALESAIILIISVLFQDWDYYPQVIQNLSSTTRRRRRGRFVVRPLGRQEKIRAQARTTNEPRYGSVCWRSWRNSSRARSSSSMS